MIRRVEGGMGCSKRGREENVNTPYFVYEGALILSLSLGGRGGRGASIPDA